VALRWRYSGIIVTAPISILQSIKALLTAPFPKMSLTDLPGEGKSAGEFKPDPMSTDGPLNSLHTSLTVCFIVPSVPEGTAQQQTGCFLTLRLLIEGWLHWLHDLWPMRLGRQR